MSFYETTHNEVTIIKCSGISASHGFSTRYGGVSTIPYLSSLNLGYGRGDDEKNVKENYRRFAQALGVSEHSFCSAAQIHSDRIFYVDAIPEHQQEGDGFVTDRAGITLTVRIADCVPILLADEKAGVIGAIHAGWRGSVSRIASKCVEKMTGLGASQENIVAAIGPSIGFCCYEVGEDFVSAFEASLGKAYLDRFVVQKSSRSHADLKGLNEALLLEAGLNKSNIYIYPECTCCKSDKFFSHRASLGLRGTMAAAISL